MIIIGGSQRVGSVHVGSVHDRLGSLPGTLPFVGAVCTAHDRTGRIRRIVEERRSGNQRYARFQGQADVAVDAPQHRGLRKVFLRFGEIFEDEIHTVVEHIALGPELVVHAVGLFNDRNSSIALDEIGIGPCTQEIDLAGQPFADRFRKRSVGLHAGQEIVHVANLAIGPVPDIEECHAGIMGRTALGHIHHVVGSHLPAGDVVGRRAPVAKEPFIGAASDVPFGEGVGNSHIE